jgi:hypothetical protein
MASERRSAAVARRRERAVESFGRAGDAIGPIEAGMAVFAITRGQWSMIDAITYCVDSLGEGCWLSVWTWTVADYEVDAMNGLMARGDLAGATLLVDMSCDRRRPELMQEWRRIFGAESVKVCRSHAKIARVWKGDVRLLLRGSMNLNFNPRFEQFDITEGGADFELVESIEAEMPVLSGSYNFADVKTAGKLGLAFPADVLAGFGELSALSDLDTGHLKNLKEFSFG